MNDDQALKGPLGILALIAGILVVIASLMAGGITEFIVPPPEKVAEELVAALGARRYEGALNQMSDELRRKVHVDDLKELVDEIDTNHQGINQAEGVDSKIQGDSASAEVRVRMQDGQELMIQLPLSSQYGVWSVDSIHPLQELAAHFPQQVNPIDIQIRR